MMTTLFMLKGQGNLLFGQDMMDGVLRFAISTEMIGFLSGLERGELIF